MMREARPNVAHNATDSCFTLAKCIYCGVKRAGCAVSWCWQQVGIHVVAQESS